MNELALFAGAGGGILGGKLLGWRTVCAVEWEPYAAGVLIARQNDGLLAPFPIWDDVRTFDGRPWRGRVDVVSGGFPCQDISAAGKGAGIDGERSGMWREMARIVREVGPRYVLVENSPMLTTRGLGRVLGDLATMGYDARWGVLGAVHAGAPHKRERIWIVANAQRLQSGERYESSSVRRWSGTTEQIGLGGCPNTLAHADGIGSASGPTDSAGGKEGQPAVALNRSEALAYSSCNGREQGGTCDAQEVQGGRQSDRGGERTDPVGDTNSQRQLQPEGEFAEGRGWPSDAGWWATEPDVGRVANGVAARMDRLKALGNGQVPAVVALAWQLLAPKT